MEGLMAAGSVVRARIDTATRDEAVVALDAMGLSISDAIRLLMVRIAADKELPFAVKVSVREADGRSAFRFRP
jgi:DNA-damage-inducible protein J